MDNQQPRAGEGESPARHDKPHDYVLYRIIGNDLVPRHAMGQARRNLAFILEHEPSFPGCEKRFVVNRIQDPDEERAIIAMLDEAGVGYLHIPFREAEYAEMTWDTVGVPARYAPYAPDYEALSPSARGRIDMRLYRHKNNYVMNNNGARNAALRDGRTRARWVLPWDGNCFVTQEGWNDLAAGIAAQPELPYFVVPMARIMDNDSLLEEGFRPIAEEEPQVIFRDDSTLEFDEAFYYGRRPKVELFWRLGVPGPWDDWAIEPWDLPCPDYAPQAGAFGRAGWVARLFSGQGHLEGKANGLVDRGLARAEAVIGLLSQLDTRVSTRLDSYSARSVITAPSSEEGSDGSLERALTAAAEGALGRGPYSVVDKTTLPPSKRLNDYWHPAPYYWPNPIPIPGLPYLPRDGRRVPGTRLYEPLSDNYDRTRLQRLFDDTYLLSLAGATEQGEAFDAHAAKLIHHWFVNPQTAMTPHLEYAQVRRGWNGNKGSSSGIIEFKDFYFLLDAVTLLERRQALDAATSTGFREWLERYLHWLQTSPQGIKERASANNHGTYYDLQVASIAAFLGNETLLRLTFRDSRSRILQQFTGEGQQPEEMKRTTTAHYCCFNLQGWIHLAELAQACGEDLWSFRGPEGESIQGAMTWLLSRMGKPWPYEQIDDFDSERFYPIYYAFVEHYDEPRIDFDVNVPRKTDIKPLFFPHDGIRPFWQYHAR